MPVKRKDNFVGAKRVMAKGQDYALLVAAELFATKVREKTPVRTGRLRSSIQSKNRVETGSIGGQKVRFVKITTDVNYGYWVEKGTTKREGRFMFRRTELEDGGEINDTFQKVLKSTVG